MSNPLQPNPETGFLESPSPNHSVALQRNYFNSDRKVHFLKLIDDCIELESYPVIHKICDTVGISLKTFEAHLKWDKRFLEEWEERKSRLRSVFTVELGHKAMSKMGTLANLAMLRYLESGTWLPETRINHVTDNSVSKSLISELPNVIDAELSDPGTQLPSPGSTPK